MLEFDRMEAEVNCLNLQFSAGKPFEHLVIDGFCDRAQVMQLYGEIPNPVAANMRKSRDYMFARNKFEKGGFKQISPRFATLYADMTGERFQSLLRKITGQSVFVDPSFHGGGIHQGGESSFLDMHVDFNVHPLHHDWVRNLNILLYLNKDWRPEYGGQLKLRHRDCPEATTEIEPRFNRCVIMFTRDYTLHGYDSIRFPTGQFRKSIACYAYSQRTARELTAPRSTVWYPDNANVAKATLGRLWPRIVRIKTALLGSATVKNK